MSPPTSGQKKAQTSAEVGAEIGAEVGAEVGTEVRARLPLLSLTTPVAMGYIPLGIVFGFLFVQAGGAWWLALAASLMVYAGAAQYLMIPMLAAGVPVGAIALATAVVNLRHVFYGLSLLQRFPARGPLRWYMVFALTDETYSVLTTLPAETPARTLGAVAALNQGWWVLGTGIGALVGAQAQVPWQGLDFVLVSLFAVLATEQWRQRTSALPVWAALGSYGLAAWLAPGQALVLSIAACVAVALVWRGPAAQAAEATQAAKATQSAGTAGTAGTAETAQATPGTQAPPGSASSPGGEGFA